MKTAITTSKIWNGGPITKDMFEEMQGAMFDSAKRIAQDARALCPVGTTEHRYKGRITKHLRDTIRARAARQVRLKALVSGIVSGEYETALPAAYVFAGNRLEGVYWQYMVEYGTYDKPAHPYMRPAVDANFNATIAEAERAGKRALNKRRRARRKR